MGTEKVLLAGLPSNSRMHFVRLQVIKKFTPVQNVGRAQFQRLLLKDEKGEKIRLTLFGDYIQIYGNIFQEDGLYDISNVTVKDGTTGSPYPQGKLMYVNDSSTILAVTNVNSTAAFVPTYLTINDTLKIDSVDECFDVVAVVVYVGEIEEKTTRTGRVTEMLKFQVTDDSCTSVVPVVVWDTTAHDVFNYIKLSADSADLLVVGLQGVHMNFYRGSYSFSGHFDCRVTFFPNDPRGIEMKEWSATNVLMIEKRYHTLMESLHNKPTIAIKTIAEALAMQSHEITVGGLVKVHAHAKGFEEGSIRTAFGCKHCGRGCEVTFREKYFCSSCNRASECVAKLYFEFSADDGTGTLCLCAQTRTAEFMLGVKAHLFHTKPEEERATYFTGVKESLRDKSFPMVLTPVTSLLLNHGLVKWTLKYVDKE